MAGQYATAFIPEIWDAAVYRTLEDNLVARKICRNYSNKVKQFGDVIHFNGLAEPTVAAYTGSITYETLNSSTVSLLINKQNQYAFDVHDIEQAMANVELKSSQAARAGYALKKACDTEILKLYTEAGTICSADANVDTTSIISDIGELKVALANQNVPENNMWLVIPPWVQLKLEMAGVRFSINEGINGTGGMQWAKVLGFDTFVTNQVHESVATPVSHIMAGSYDAIVYAEALMKSEVLRAETAFAWHLRGLHVHGYKVVKPLELATMTMTYTAESSTI